MSEMTRRPKVAADAPKVAADAPKVAVTTAADILKSDHPVNAAFLASLNGAEPSKRKAREFLAANPTYRTPKEA